MGLITIDVMSKITYLKSNLILDLILLTLIFVASYFTGYFLFGVLVILYFYYAFESRLSIVFLIMSAAALNFNIVSGLAAVESIFIIYYLHAPFKVKRLKGYYFYAFYPLHLLMLAFIKISV